MAVKHIEALHSPPGANGHTDPCLYPLAAPRSGTMTPEITSALCHWLQKQRTVLINCCLSTALLVILAHPSDASVMRLTDGDAFDTTGYRARSPQINNKGQVLWIGRSP